jgi:hypothetical protein
MRPAAGYDAAILKFSISLTKIIQGDTSIS